MKGYTQTYGFDYQEMFSSVTKLSTIWVLFSTTANIDWPLHQFHVKNAFLLENLTEEVFMDLPVGRNYLGGDRRVCRLCDDLSRYGLV